MLDPEPIEHADYLLVESTYGDRRHEPRPQDILAEVISRTTGRGGTVVVPAFAVGRPQTLMYHLHQLKATRRIADVPVSLTAQWRSTPAKFGVDMPKIIV
jgi:metallo-beta-lactamase family protein